MNLENTLQEVGKPGEERRLHTNSSTETDSPDASRRLPGVVGDHGDAKDKNAPRKAPSENDKAAERSTEFNL